MGPSHFFGQAPTKVGVASQVIEPPAPSSAVEVLPLPRVRLVRVTPDLIVTEPEPARTATLLVYEEVFLTPASGHCGRVHPTDMRSLCHVR